MTIFDRDHLKRSFARFFPPACAGCEGSAVPDQAFCSICQWAATPLRPPCCARCSVPMDRFYDSEATSSLCSRCQRHRPAYRQVMAYWEYDGAVADAIRRIKYGNDLPALRALCRGAQRWFTSTLAELPPGIPIVAIPAHRQELRRRGFHVPSLALRFLRSRGATWQVAPILEKRHPTPSQASLPFAERHKNVAGAFRARGPDPNSTAAILFDDVLTTGATANAACGALKEAGFDDVYVLVLARAPRTNL